MRTKDARALARIRNAARRLRQAVIAADSDEQTRQHIPTVVYTASSYAGIVDDRITDRLNGWEGDR